MTTDVFDATGSQEPDRFAIAVDSVLGKKLRKRRKFRGVRWSWLLALNILWAPPLAAECAGWNTEAYFQNASAASVTNCLREGADPNARGEGGRTPLHWAARKENHAVLAALLDVGADPNAPTKYGWTPLHSAAENANPAVAAALLDAGAEPNALAKNGWAPLHVAARNGDSETAKLLVAHGADVNAKTNDGETPLDVSEAEAQAALRNLGGRCVKSC